MKRSGQSPTIELRSWTGWSWAGKHVGTGFTDAVVDTGGGVVVVVMGGGDVVVIRGGVVVVIRGCDVVVMGGCDVVVI